MRPIITFFVIFFMVILTEHAFADGMPIENGRFVGKVTTLVLTPNQIKSIERDRSLELTQVQKEVLKKEAGLTATRFYVYETRKGENDCTCFAWNRALRYSEDQVEIPHEYLVTDEEAVKRQKELDEID